jgi:2-polyprenyl-3-methyl-5-hydroxy-6-metoxy-1,4-benzoquinol methylase
VTERSANKNDVAEVENAVARCYSTWGDSYYRDYYGPDASYPPVHRDIVVAQIKAHGGRRIIDAGCGPASILRHLAGPERDLHGFDLTPEMIAEARRVMAPLGVPDQRLWTGSVLNRDSYWPAGTNRTPYDCALCIGVLPHITAGGEEALIDNLRAAVRPGGLVLVEARNELFSFFTMNRYSHQFVLERLIPLEILSRDAGDEKPALGNALAGLKSMFRTDMPPIRQGKEGEPGYDEILSRLHNPIVLTKQFESRGFRDVRPLFYHFHCLPPMIGAQVPNLFRKHSLTMEQNADDWRGYFMASAFIIAAVRS